MSEPTYHIYEIRNSINDKTYRGAHYGTPDDDYMGSGKAIRAAIKKYGRMNFTKTILCECESEDLMYAKECELVNPEFVSRNDTYNIRLGGQGGPINHNAANWSQERRDAQSAITTAYFTVQEHRDKLGARLKAIYTQERKDAQSARRKGIPLTQKHKDACKAYWTQERRDARSDKTKAFYAVQEHRDAQSARLKACWSQEQRDAQSARMKALYTK